MIINKLTTKRIGKEIIINLQGLSNAIIVPDSTNYIDIEKIISDEMMKQQASNKLNIGELQW